MFRLLSVRPSLALLILAVLPGLVTVFAPSVANAAPASTSSTPSTSTPAPLSPTQIDTAIARAGELARTHSLLVAIDGTPVIEHVYRGPGLAGIANIKSLSKTVMSALVGEAIDRGVIESVDQPIVTLLGPWVPDDIDPQVREITVGHLLSMQAGLEPTSGENYGAWVASPNWVRDALTRPFVDRPGGCMLYSTGNTHLLSAALTQATGRSTLALMRDWLGAPLDIRIPPWTRGPQGIYFGGNEMGLSPRALLQLGELYRQGGMIEGEQILPQAWIEQSWTPRTHSFFNQDDYGYGWFITELAGEPVYYGWGYGGQMLYVIPGRAMTVVITSDPTPPASGSEYLDGLEAVISGLIEATASSSPQALPESHGN